MLRIFFGNYHLLIFFELGVREKIEKFILDGQAYQLAWLHLC